MTKEPTEGEQHGRVHDTEIKFDLNKFSAELAQTTQEYATASWSTYGGGTVEANQGKKRRSVELFGQLVDMCAHALVATAADEKILKVIHQTLIAFQYKGGPMLFEGSDIADFYRELSMHVARIKMEGKDE